jgi:hypothetical protein
LATVGISVRAGMENKLSYLGTVKMCVAMRCMKGVNVKVEVDRAL